MRKSIDNQPEGWRRNLFVPLIATIAMLISAAATPLAAADENVLHKSKIDWSSIGIDPVATLLHQPRLHGFQASKELSALTDKVNKSPVPVLVPKRLFVKHMSSFKSPRKALTASKPSRFILLVYGWGYTLLAETEKKHELICRSSNLTVLSKDRSLASVEKDVDPVVVENNLGGYSASFQRSKASYICEIACGIGPFPGERCMIRVEFLNLLNDLVAIGPNK